MHWHRHKTGARHFEAWKEKGGRMPVTVTLGGVIRFIRMRQQLLCRKNIDEYLLAGSAQKRE